jgi:hypothetical protein
MEGGPPPAEGSGECWRPVYLYYGLDAVMVLPYRHGRCFDTRDHGSIEPRAGDPADVPAPGAERTMEVTTFLCEDVVTGRGTDQVLPHHVDPSHYEPCIPDARA